MKYILIAGALFSALVITPALADTAGPTQAEVRAAVQAQPIAPVTDAELRNYAIAQAELASVYPSPVLSAAHNTRIRAETSAVLMRHNLTATRYNEITTAIDLNANLARRYASIVSTQTPGV